MGRFSNINTILAFVTVAREGSVSRAAEVLHLTQPAVSHQIRRLSKELGVTLFTRTATGVEITQDGDALLAKAEQVLQAMSEFRRSARKRVGRVSGKLRIGTIVDPQFIRLGQLLNQMREDFPEIETELVHGVSGEVVTRLQRNQIDAGFFLSGPNPAHMLDRVADPAVHFVKLADFSYKVIAPAGWQARLDGKDWADLARLPWIGTPEMSVHSRLLSGIFHQLGCEQNVVALVDQEASMLEMVRSGLGLSLCRDSIALHQRQTLGLAVSDQVSVPASLSFVAPDRHKDAPVLEALLSLLDDLWHSGRQSGPD